MLASLQFKYIFLREMFSVLLCCSLNKEMTSTSDKINPRPGTL